jgi:hypothetical protein
MSHRPPRPPCLTVALATPQADMSGAVRVKRQVRERQHRAAPFIPYGITVDPADADIDTANVTVKPS